MSAQGLRGQQLLGRGGSKKNRLEEKVYSCLWDLADRHFSGKLGELRVSQVPVPPKVSCCHMLHGRTGVPMVVDSENSKDTDCH